MLWKENLKKQTYMKRDNHWGKNRRTDGFMNLYSMFSDGLTYKVTIELKEGKK